MSDDATPREKVAVATLALPAVAVLVTALMWWPELPAEISRQWDGDGVSSTMPRWLALGGAIVLTLLAAVGALLALPAAAAPNRTRIFFASGFAGGLAAGFWLFLAGLAAASTANGVSATGGAEAVYDPGGLGMLALLAGAFGIVPWLIGRRPFVDPYAADAR
ncbi:MAG: hypothetical protein JWQ43_391 [Glaciihabitans sp.]|nr:hypothetical protein [Glaciihabitans sp.]